jgi:sigma54-dependent transcription regulator
MTKPEISKAIEEKLKEDPFTSDKSIADLYGTNNGTVNKIRQRLIYNKVIEDPYYRRGADGKFYRVRQSKETAKIIRPIGYN